MSINVYDIKIELHISEQTIFIAAQENQLKKKGEKNLPIQEYLHILILMV